MPHIACGPVRRRPCTAAAGGIKTSSFGKLAELLG
jgi:hypothetical protein